MALLASHNPMFSMIFCLVIIWFYSLRLVQKDKDVFFLENDQEKYSSSLRQQSSETKSNTELVLVSQETDCFMSNLTNPINKMFMRLIYSKNSTFLGLKIIVHTD